MHSFGRYCTAVIVALASLDVCAQADLKAGADAASHLRQAPTPEPTSSRLLRRGTKNCLPRSRASRNPPASLSRISVWSSTATGASSSGTLPAGSRTTRSGRPPPFRRRRSSGSVRSATNTARSSFFNGCAISTRTARCRPRRRPQIEKLETIAAAAAPTTTPAVADTTIRAVHRTVLAEVVRVTLELDREVPFYQERLEGPARVFFDLKGTKTVPSLVDATFRYDSDVIRHIRIGRHPNNTTRVVLDLENVSRFSVFTLYNPYRIVIDAERSARDRSQTGRSDAACRTDLRGQDRHAVRATGTGRVSHSAPAIRTRRARITRTSRVRAAVPVAVIARAAVVLPAAPPPITAPSPRPSAWCRQCPRRRFHRRLRPPPRMRRRRRQVRRLRPRARSSRANPSRRLPIRAESFRLRASWDSASRGS